MYNELTGTVTNLVFTQLVGDKRYQGHNMLCLVQQPYHRSQMNFGKPFFASHPKFQQLPEAQAVENADCGTVA